MMRFNAILPQGKCERHSDSIRGKIDTDVSYGFRGMLYENVIAQMLTANGHKLFFYTRYSEEKHRNDIEIDFLISNNSKLKYKSFPIEVKSGKRYTMK